MKKPISRAKLRAKIVDDLNFCGNEAWEYQQQHDELERKLARFDRRTKELRKKRRKV